MNNSTKSIRTFIGAKDFQVSRRFYIELGCEESIISEKLSLFYWKSTVAFYLQEYYVKDWVDNSMLFLEVNDLDAYWKFIDELALPKKYKDVRVSKIVDNDWGREFFLHDPSGVLWHIGSFKTAT